MYTVTKRMEVAGAHSLSLPYKSKCTNLHGHNWIIEIEVTGPFLNADGMLIDFTRIKKIVNQLDHTLVNEFTNQPTAENIAKWIEEQINMHIKSKKTKKSNIKKAQIKEGVIESICQFLKERLKTSSYISKSEIHQFLSSKFGNKTKKYSEGMWVTIRRQLSAKTQKDERCPLSAHGLKVKEIHQAREHTVYEISEIQKTKRPQKIEHDAKKDNLDDAIDWHEKQLPWVSKVTVQESEGNTACVTTE